MDLIKKPVIIDLFSGLGGASEAFVQAGWEVIRIENNPKLQYVPHTYDLDVMKWREWIDDMPRADIIWASPPCTEFSNAYNAPRSKAFREKTEYWPNLKLLEATEAIIHQLNPTWWIVENVAGSERYFKDIVGQCRQVVSSFHLYGEFPFIPMGEFRHIKKDVGSKNPMRANIRAQIPFELSFGLLQTWEEQTSLLEWI